MAQKWNSFSTTSEHIPVLRETCETACPGHLFRRARQVSVRSAGETVLEVGEPGVVYPDAAVSGIEEEGVLPNVHPRAPAAAGETRTEGSGTDEGAGATSEDRAPGRAAFRLCNLVAQGPRDAKGEFKREVEKERN